ncbi:MULTISPECIES: 23S rRNA (adenine(2503)-C(2))-methyltransferase RlmN [Actinomyces]|uniref:23S rRNA (adenine(2503)-C(2))-methyltransferase RlmN n=1 Tax=Actinomyces TaxID=1654 RepID=UPI001FAA42E4|nr:MULTISPECIES: 23S rRNA (adenine(2503)-C(2))-methyltransferase RlmN [Actinomyces]
MSPTSHRPGAPAGRGPADRGPAPVSRTGPAGPAPGEAQVLPTDQPPEGATSPDARPRLSLAVPTPRGKAPRHLADLDLAGRKAACRDAGLPGFRADQVSRHYFSHLTRDPARMTDLPASQRDQLCAELLPPLVREVRALRADAGRTVKYLWELHDGVRVESVLMRYEDRTTLCVSSQAGCGMACPFCATGQMGLTRNLSAAEIVEQVRHAALASARGDLTGGPARLSNVVFMGMGEPMINYRNVVAALHRLVDPAPEGFGMSARSITVSTVGVVPLIRRLAGEGIPVTLAVSLHAPDDALRDELVPVNSRWKVADLLDAAYDYFRASGRRVSIEYALIKDMNDHAWRAQRLAEELSRRGRGWAHVNPIPLNPTPGSIWTCSTPQAQQSFVDTLRCAGITTTVRDTRGSDIDGACGQLATEVLNQERARTQ